MKWWVGECRVGYFRLAPVKYNCQTSPVINIFPNIVVFNFILLIIHIICDCNGLQEIIVILFDFCKNIDRY